MLRKPTLFTLGNGTNVALSEGSGVGHCTGDVIWESAYVAARFVEDAERLPRDVLLGEAAQGAAAPAAAGGAKGAVRRPRILDLSAGTGLVGISCACLGAHVVMSDYGAAGKLLLENNIAANADAIAAAGGVCEAYDYAWGDGIDDGAGKSGSGAAAAAAAPPLLTRAPFDLVMCVDCVFIGVRDSIMHLLLRTLVALCPPPSGDGRDSLARRPQLVLAWKVRVEEKEAAFLAELAQHFELEEVAREQLCYKDFDRRVCADGAGSDSDASSDGGMGSLFYHEDDDNVRVLLGRRK